MKNLTILVAFVVLIAVHCINAQFPRRKPSSNVVTWQVDINSDLGNATQKAVSMRSRDAVFLYTYGKGMKDMNLTSSSMLMEYSDSAGVLAVRVGPKRRGGMCVLIPMSETFSQIETDLETKKDTVISLSTTVAFNGTEDPLSREETDSVFEQHPTLKLFCYRSKIVEATSMTLGDEDPDTKTVTMLAWDSRVALMLRGAGGPGGDKPQGGSGRRRPKWPRGPLFPRRRG